MTLTSPWPLPLAFTSWAFNKDASGQPVDRDAVYNVSKHADRMAALTIAVQITEGITATEVHALRQNGFQVVAWCLCDERTEQLLADLGPFDGFMPQIEGDGQYDATVAAFEAGVGANLPRSIVSDWGGLGSKEKCDVLRGHGATTVFVEAYAEGGAQHADLPHYVVEFGAARGYTADQCIPLLGTYRNEYPSAYAGIDNYAGGNFSVYLLEPMTDGQLDAFAAVAATAPEPEPPQPIPPTNGGTVPSPPKDTDCRATVRFASTTWEAQQTSYQARARLVVARRICDDTNTNDRWTQIRDQIVSLLDQQGIAK